MIPIELDNPSVIDRAAFWWERCLVRILHHPKARTPRLEELVRGVPDRGLRECGFPST